MTIFHPNSLLCQPIPSPNLKFEMNIINLKNIDPELLLSHAREVFSHRLGELEMIRQLLCVKRRVVCVSQYYKLISFRFVVVKVIFVAQTTDAFALFYNTSVLRYAAVLLAVSVSRVSSGVRRLRDGRVPRLYVPVPPAFRSPSRPRRRPEQRRPGCGQCAVRELPLLPRQITKHASKVKVKVEVIAAEQSPTTLCGH